MAYYCIGCGQCHSDPGDGLMFRTGYHVLPSGEKVPAGLCELNRAVLQSAHLEPEAADRRMAG